MQDKSADFAPGTVIAGRYRIEEVLGRGSFGTVYSARHRNFRRAVALRVLDPDLVAEHRELFRREAELVRQLHHPNTVFLFDYGQGADEPFFLAYELVRGTTLTAEIEQTKVFAAERVGRISRQLLGSLAEAHHHGVVHRDIKPSNILLTQYAGESDFVRVLDFGIAKDLSSADAIRLAQTGETLGNPSYMAPEQIIGKGASAATDLYAVGLVMAEMISGRAVFQGTPLSIVVEQLSADPPPLSPALHQHRLGPVVRRATDKDPNRRYKSAAAMLEHIRKIEQAIKSKPPSAPPPEPEAVASTIEEPPEIEVAPPPIAPAPIPPAPIAPAPIAPIALEDVEIAPPPPPFETPATPPTPIPALEETPVAVAAPPPAPKPPPPVLVTEPEPLSAEVTLARGKGAMGMLALGAAALIGIVVVVVVATGDDEPAKPTAPVVEPPTATSVVEAPPKPPPPPPSAPSAEPTTVAVRDLKPEDVRAAVEAEGWKVTSDRVVTDSQAGTQTFEFQVEKDPVNHGIVYLTKTRSNVQALRIAAPGAVVDDSVILFIVLKANDDTQERLRKRLARDLPLVEAKPMLPQQPSSAPPSPSTAPPP